MIIAIGSQNGHNTKNHDQLATGSIDKTFKTMNMIPTTSKHFISFSLGYKVCMKIILLL